MCVWVVVVTERGRGIVRSSALCVHLCVCVFVCGRGGVGGWLDWGFTSPNVKFCSLDLLLWRI